MKETFKKLLTIKSIVTLALTITFVVLSILGFKDGNDVPEYFKTIYSVVIAFYFGSQYERRNSEINKDNGLNN